MMRLRPLLASLFLALAALAGAGRADVSVFYAENGAAIRGYDPVAYFTDGAPVRGRSEISVMWKGVVWLFASQEHREAFEANPRAYAPQFGGYCAYAVSRGYRARTEPDAWAIVDGRLYLIRSKGVRAVWQQDARDNIARAAANWPAVLGE